LNIGAFASEMQILIVCGVKAESGHP